MEPRLLAIYDQGAPDRPGTRRIAGEQYRAIQEEKGTLDGLGRDVREALRALWHARLTWCGGEAWQSEWLSTIRCSPS